LGTSNTVTRALRLISESGLEDGGVELLAERLGIGSRHLRRLFLRHLGASPIAVAHTRRLHFAKKLLDETKLPMAHVAQASGFGCVRRFNAAIRTTYHRTPTQIRSLARQTSTPLENEYVFKFRFRPPYQWESMLSFLALRATPGVEAVEHGRYRRSIFVNNLQGHFEVSLAEEPNTLNVRIQFADPRSLFLITERIRRMFDVNADWQPIASRLRIDPALCADVSAKPGLRLPGCWDGFELATRAILGQQVTVKGASTLAGRLVRAFGRPLSRPNGLTHLFPQPEVLAEAKPAQIGLPAKRAEAIRSLARAVSGGDIDFNVVSDSDAFVARLAQLPGIGHWTTQYVAMRALGEPDAFPAGDIRLLQALGMSSAAALEARAERWRPWRAYAALYLWSSEHDRVKAPSAA
jgi:AraC family transcriptional regulator of adaptative response / DNA-3-methyladenine glycosylase II